MGEITLGMVEARFADIVWANEPISTKQLIEMCEKELEWKRTTTYTVLKRLSEKGIFEMKNGVVTSLISKEEFSSMQCENFVRENFQGSLSAFLAAFTSRQKITDRELNEIRQMIADYGKEE